MSPRVKVQSPSTSPTSEHGATAVGAATKTPLELLSAPSTPPPPTVCTTDPATAALGADNPPAAAPSLSTMAMMWTSIADAPGRPSDWKWSWHTSEAVAPVAASTAAPTTRATPAGAEATSTLAQMCGDGVALTSCTRAASYAMVISKAPSPEVVGMCSGTRNAAPGLTDGRGGPVSAPSFTSPTVGTRLTHNGVLVCTPPAVVAATVAALALWSAVRRHDDVTEAAGGATKKASSPG
mmetsp:Transcript_1739/g.5572  ORF Transcript_1739/g.5572 Transcript_1739/m.5572 type:complete len:238 (+) Transcript_1739:321-1034(+)